MPPFSITCTTCKTRLKVRDESAIGQILACPKCGGLVMVKPPDDPASAPSDSAETRPDISTIAPRPAPTYNPGDTLPATNFEDIDSILSDAPPRPRDPVPGGSKKARVSINDSAGQSGITLGGASAVRKTAVKGAADAKESAPATGSSSTILPSTLPAAEGSSLSGKSGSRVAKARGGIHPESAAAPSDPATVAAAVQPAPGGGSAIGQQAASDSSASGPSPYPFASDASDASPAALAKTSWWHWPLITAAIGAGVLLAVTVVYASFSLLSHSSEPISQNPATELPVSDAVAPNKSNPQSKASDASPAEAPPQAAEKPAQPPAEQQPKKDPAAPSGEKPTQSTAPAAPPQPVPPAEPEVKTKTPPAAEPPQTEKPPSGQDPLGMVPATPPATAIKPPAAKISDPLAGFGKLVDAPAADPIPVEQSSATSGVELPLDESLDDGSRPALPRPQPREVDVAARLADPLPAIEVSGVPLVDYLRFVQDLSTISITLEPDALWFARASAIADVNTQGQNLTVGGALTGGLKPLGLEHTVVNGQLVVALIEPSPLSQIQYPIKDLTAGDEQRAAELVEWMQSLVRPHSWGEGLGSLSVGEDTITTQQKRAIHAELLQFFEKLRVARGLRPLSRFDAANFRLETRLARAQPKLDTPITLNFSQPALLTRIVERLEKAAQVRILIDWQSLAPLGWNPDGEATLLTENEPLGQALTKLTEPMDLTWRAVDERTFQILSPQAAQEKLELEFYPLAANLSAATAADEGEALLARLRNALGDERFREAGGRCDLRYDAESKHLLASLPQPLQKKLAAVLAELQATAPPRDIQ